MAHKLGQALFLTKAHALIRIAMVTKAMDFMGAESAHAVEFLGSSAAPRAQTQPQSKPVDLAAEKGEQIILSSGTWVRACKRKYAACHAGRQRSHQDWG